MNKTEHLLTIIAEECAEVAQRATKAARFGVSEAQPGQLLDNYERIMREWVDLVAVLELFIEHENLPHWTNAKAEALIQEKKARVKEFMEYAEKKGTLRP